MKHKIIFPFLVMYVDAMGKYRALGGFATQDLAKDYCEWALDCLRRAPETKLNQLYLVDMYGETYATFQI